MTLPTSLNVNWDFMAWYSVLTFSLTYLCVRNFDGVRDCVKFLKSRGVDVGDMVEGPSEEYVAMLACALVYMYTLCCQNAIAVTLAYFVLRVVVFALPSNHYGNIVPIMKEVERWKKSENWAPAHYYIGNEPYYPFAYPRTVRAYRRIFRHRHSKLTVWACSNYSWLLSLVVFLMNAALFCIIAASHFNLGGLD